MKFKLQNAGTTVDLGKDQFLAKGGEGSIYAVADTVYKICEPGRMIPEGKIRELAVLDHPRIVKPEDVLLNTKGKPVGYTMRLVPNGAIPLAQMLSRTYREREGVTPPLAQSLVKQIADGVRAIHKHPGYLQVDGNELNYMVTDAHQSVYFIDVNSYQTPHHPADAIMPSIRDWSVRQGPKGDYLWSTLSDWYSFAVISFYLFTAVHPFKHRHPRFPDLKTAMTEQMRAGVSVLDKEAGFPKGAVYFPFEDFIPGGKGGAFMQWYRAVFVEGRRLPPPGDFQATLNPAAQVRQIAGSNNFVLKLSREFASTVTGYAERNGRKVVVTAGGPYVDNQPGPKTAGRYRVGFTEKTNTPVAVVQEQDRYKVIDLARGRWLPTPAEPFVGWADNCMAYDGRLYCQYQDTVYELSFAESADILPMPVAVAHVLPKAVQVFPGVFFQDLFGARLASVFPSSRLHRQIKIDELQGVKIVDAKYENQVLMTLTLDREGEYARTVFRFAADWTGYDARKVDNVTPTGLNFTVLGNGVVICLTEEEKVEVFMNQRGSPGVKSIDDPAVHGDMHLYHSGTQAHVAHGNKFYDINMRS